MDFPGTAAALCQIIKDRISGSDRRARQGWRHISITTSTARLNVADHVSPLIDAKDQDRDILDDMTNSPTYILDSSSTMYYTISDLNIYSRQTRQSYFSILTRPGHDRSTNASICVPRCAPSDTNIHVLCSRF